MKDGQVRGVYGPVAIEIARDDSEDVTEDVVGDIPGTLARVRFLEKVGDLCGVREVVHGEMVGDIAAADVSDELVVASALQESVAEAAYPLDGGVALGREVVEEDGEGAIAIAGGGERLVLVDVGKEGLVLLDDEVQAAVEAQFVDDGQVGDDVAGAPAIRVGGGSGDVRDAVEQGAEDGRSSAEAVDRSGEQGSGGSLSGLGAGRANKSATSVTRDRFRSSRWGAWRTGNANARKIECDAARHGRRGPAILGVMQNTILGGTPRRATHARRGLGWPR